MQPEQASALEKKRLKAIKAPKEKNIHQQVVEFLHLACPENGAVLWHHIPNEQVMAGVIRKLCIGLFGKDKGLKYSQNIISSLIAFNKKMGVRSGMPDLAFQWNINDTPGPTLGPPRSAYIELKRDGGQKLSTEQVKIQLWCERLGIFYHVCSSADTVETVLRAWGVPLKASMRRLI
jgi:hypothetical protein